MASDRQLKILILIVKNYIRTGNSVSSINIKDENNLDISSATIRNDMVSLEKEGYIEKEYKSSGRIPTLKGYEYYIKNIKSNPDMMEYWVEKMEDIFSNREQNINEIINKALKVINDSTNTILVSKENIGENIYIKEMKVYKIDSSKYLLVSITSDGKLYNEDIFLEDEEKYKDFEKAFKTVSSKLIGTKVSQIKEMSEVITNIISKDIKFEEKKLKFIIENIIVNLFVPKNDFPMINNLASVDFFEKKDEVKKILEMVEEKTIWEIIEKLNSNLIDNSSNKVLLDISEEGLDGVSLVKRTLKYGDSRKDVVFIGSKNQDYEKIFTLLELLDKKIKE